MEDEVLRLKDCYATILREKESLAAENAQLKRLLASNGISGKLVGRPGTAGEAGSNQPLPETQSPHHSAPSHSPGLGTRDTAPGRQAAKHDTSQEQAGIDFVLSYADPSRAYMTPPPQ
jgi:hypothetical protein